MQTALVIIHVIIAVVLTVIVLMQHEMCIRDRYRVVPCNRNNTSVFQLRRFIARDEFVGCGTCA